MSQTDENCKHLWKDMKELRPPYADDFLWLQREGKIFTPQGGEAKTPHGALGRWLSWRRLKTLGKNPSVEAAEAVTVMQKVCSPSFHKPPGRRLAFRAQMGFSSILCVAWRRVDILCWWCYWGMLSPDSEWQEGLLKVMQEVRCFEVIKLLVCYV